MLLLCLFMLWCVQAIASVNGHGHARFTTFRHHRRHQRGDGIRHRHRVRREEHAGSESSTHSRIPSTELDADVHITTPPAGHIFVEPPLLQPPPGWRSIGPMHPDQLIDLHLFLPPPVPERILDAATDVSTPGSAAFGNVFSRMQVALLSAPSDRDMSRVMQWLVFDAGISRDTLQPTDNSGIIRLRLPVARVEQLLHARMVVYEDPSGTRIGRTLSYAVPEIAGGSVSFIGPLLQFPEPSVPANPAAADAHAAVAGNGVGAGIGASGCEATDPAHWRTLHGVTQPPRPAAMRAVTLASDAHTCGAKAADVLVAALHGRVLASDVRVWASKALGEPVSATESVCWRDARATSSVDAVSVIATSPRVDVAATAATQLLVGMGVGHVEVREAAAGRAWTAAEAAPTTMDVHTDPVHALLYSLWGEQDKPVAPLPRTLLLPWWVRETHLSEQARQRLAIEVAKLALLRVSVVVPAGDAGPAACRADIKSTTPVLVPGFPAACPFVTSVAALGGNTSALQADRGSTGGFSMSASPLPAMLTRMHDYLLLAATDLPPANVFRRDGSPFPAAASARGLAAVVDGSPTVVCGSTLAAAGTAAAVARVNTVMHVQDGLQVGLVSLLAATGGAEDVTAGRSGDGATCADAGDACACGFPATQGWDAASGAGVVTAVLLEQSLRRAKAAAVALSADLQP